MTASPPLPLLRQPYVKLRPSRTWPRLKRPGRTSPSTAVCLWPSPSWWWPQAFRSFMASQLKVQPQLLNDVATLTKRSPLKKTESLRGQRAAEEEDVGLTVRRTGRLRHSRPPPEVNAVKQITWIHLSDTFIYWHEDKPVYMYHRS